MATESRETHLFKLLHCIRSHADRRQRPQRKSLYRTLTALNNSRQKSPGDSTVHERRLGDLLHYFGAFLVDLALWAFTQHGQVADGGQGTLKDQVGWWLLDY